MNSDLPRLLLDESPDALIAFTPDGKVLYWNNAAERIFGFSAAEAHGRLLNELIIPTDRLAEESRALGRAIEAGFGTYETTRRRRNGSLVHVGISARPVRDVHGKTQLIITSTKERSCDSRREWNEELETFYYSISHDLRAPVRAMAGFARILSRELEAQLSDDCAFALKRIGENATKMGSLIDGLLNFSRSSWQALVRTTVSPGPVVQSVLGDLRHEFAARRVQVEVEELPACEADPALLRQVFAHLLSNALKYTRGRDPAEIKVGVRRQTDHPVYFVEDNGVGFDMEHASKLFGVFQRLHPEEQFEGAGVGLAIVQRIVERHGGSTWAEAAIDRGATFYFTLKDGQ